MFILKKGHQPGVYVPLRALFLVWPRWRTRTMDPKRCVLYDHYMLFRLGVLSLQPLLGA